MDGGFNKAVVAQDTMDGTGHGRIEGRATNQRITGAVPCVDFRRGNGDAS